MPRPMEITEIGDVYELKRDQWRGNTARISNDPKLLEEVRKYTWTYSEGKHPYLRCSKLGVSLHEFVLGHIYGNENVKQMLAEGNIIEHLDNNGLNCTYENLHILSEDLNKTKAFSIDKKNKEDDSMPYPAYVLDVYYLHNKKQFQMQIFMNDDILFDYQTGTAIEMCICKYTNFEELFPDWFYLLYNRIMRTFDIAKLHASQTICKQRTMISGLSPDEINNQLIIRDGVLYINLDAKVNGVPPSVRHTALRKIEGVDAKTME